MQKIYSSLIVLCILLTVGTVSAQSLRDRTREIGVSAACWLPADLNIEGEYFEKESSFLLRAFGDFYVMPKLAMGIFFNYSSCSDGSTDINLFEFGDAIKPGFNLAYRFTGSDASAAEIDAFGLTGSVELQKQMENLMIHGEIGFLSQPAGGNDWVEVTFAPIVYFGGGITC